MDQDKGNLDVRLFLIAMKKDLYIELINNIKGVSLGTSQTLVGVSVLPSLSIGRGKGKIFAMSKPQLNVNSTTIHPKMGLAQK